MADEIKNNQFSWLKRMKFIVDIFKLHWLWITALLIIEALTTGLNAIIPYFTKLQVDQLQQKASEIWIFANLTPATVFTILVIVPVSLEVIRLFVFQRSEDVWSAQFSSELRLGAERLLWDKLRTLDVAFFINKRNQVILRSAFEAATVTQAAWQFLRMRVRDIAALLVILPILALIGWRLLAIVLFTTAMQAGIGYWYRRKSAALLVLWDLSIDKFWFLEGLLMRDFVPLQTLGVVEKFLQKREQAARERDRLNMQRDLMEGYRRQYSGLISELLAVVVNVIVGMQVLGGGFTLGTFTIMVSYTLQLNRVLGNWLESLQEWGEMDLQFDRLGFFFGLQSRMKIGGNLKIEAFESLAMRKVDFRYPDFSIEERAYAQMLIAKTLRFMGRSLWYKRQLDDWKQMIEVKEEKPLVLAGVDLNLKAGQVVALLGRNGAGKTTLTNLLMRLYEPERGQILLNGKSLEIYNTDWLHQQFAVVQQWPLMLQRFSVRENLLLGVGEQLSDKQIWGLLESLDLDQVIRGLPKQLETILGEEYSLSGGQEQLLAVGRALLQRRPVIIFDEGMSQLDIEHETKVLRLLREQAMRYKAAVLFITHRITTARKADLIYMLDQGKIAEKGAHEQLLEKKDGLYAKFWKMQVVE